MSLFKISVGIILSYNLFNSAIASIGKQPAYRIELVKYDIRYEEHIGTLKVGALCLPHGKIRWGDLRVPSEFESRSLIIGSLAENGVITRNAEDLSDADTPMLSLKIVSANVKLCIPGISDLIGKPKFSGFIHMIWQVKGPVAYTAEMDIPLIVSGIDPRNSSSALDQALKEGARRFLIAAPSHLKDYH